MGKGHTPRFYIGQIPESGTVSLNSEQSRHLKVLRVSEDEQIELFDGQNEYTGRLKGPETIEITGKSEPKGSSGVNITLLTSFPKGKQLDFLIQKATEAGVDKIIPLISERSVVDPGENKLERMKKIAINACEQCGRTKIPEITGQITVDKIKNLKNGYDQCFLAEKNGKKIEKISGKNILAIVGPEGGFTEQEISEISALGCTPISLGNTELRIETAGILMVGILNSIGA